METAAVIAREMCKLAQVWVVEAHLTTPKQERNSSISFALAA